MTEIPDTQVRHLPGLFRMLETSVFPAGRKRVLDMGTGEFFWTRPGYEMHYSDVKDRAHKDFTRIDYDAPPFPIGSKTFDMVVAIELVEHLERPFDFFSECGRILRDRGVLVLTTPNLDSRAAREIFKDRGYLPYFDPPALEPRDGHRTPVFRFELERWMEKAGWWAWRFFRYGPNDDILVLRGMR